MESKESDVSGGLREGEWEAREGESGLCAHFSCSNFITIHDLPPSSSSSSFSSSSSSFFSFSSSSSSALTKVILPLVPCPSLLLLLI
ncbi:hypothetical protein E2C01_079002 [Portunus trituberculatus]|uniref:Uncharacterized protein n=1 Tax=Portunus trituberculatus TaxID=210409 RepID=A0A5B7III8_PORTR|nr:hypothetical protein [Portunus trituberculatus]